MQRAYIVTGTLTDGHTVRLDEELPLTATKVRVVLEPLTKTAERSYADVIAEIRHRQQQRGHQPPTREAVDARIESQRNSWEE